MEKVIVASTNPAKIEAVKKVFESLKRSYSLISLHVESGVSKTPLSNEEGITGCLQRIESAKKINPGGDVYVGLEGIIDSNRFGSFICGWAVVDWVKLKRKGILADIAPTILDMMKIKKPEEMTGESLIIRTE